MGNSDRTHQINALFKNMGDYNSTVLYTFNRTESETFNFNFSVFNIVIYLAWHFIYFFLFLLLLFY
jgi:hypothetical protein